MPNYRYNAKDGTKNIEGVIEAQNREEAVEKISQRGFMPVRVEEETSVKRTEPAVKSRFSGKIKSREITVFSRQLSSLLKSGVSILKALNIISRQSETSQFKELLEEVHSKIKAGGSLSQALADYPRIFSPLFIAMIKSGEESGNLHEVLLRIGGYRRKQEEIISQVRSALAYPILMAIVGLGTIIFMLTYVMPRLMRIFDRLGQKLPLPTQILISLSYGLKQWWFLILIFIAVIFFILRRSSRNKVQKLVMSRLKLRLPLIGDFILKSELARLSRTLELLIKNGIPILQAIKIAAPILNNEILKNGLYSIHKKLQEGGSFGRSMEESKLFPGFMSNLVVVGEESGRLDEALAEVADSYERDTAESIRLMTSLLEPVMILIMGLIVGFIVISMLLPVFQINVMAR